MKNKILAEIKNFEIQGKRPTDLIISHLLFDELQSEFGGILIDKVFGLKITLSFNDGFNVK